MGTVINYKGKSFTTHYDFEQITDSEFENIRQEYYKKPDFESVQKEMKTIFKGGSKNTNITNYYFRDLLDKTTLLGNKWCIEDVFNSKELLSYFWYRIQQNDKIFLPTETIRRKLDTAFRIGGMGIASRVSNFPIKVVDTILKEYNVNNNYYDFCCGWGARLTSSLKNKVNYFGTDPNYLLVDKLNEFANDFKTTTGTDTKVDIRANGSEKYIPEWKETIGVAFSSPPYFNLEDYKIGDQSYKEGVTYDSWLNNFLRPTIENIYKYLVQNGYFIINIKDQKDFDLESDTVNIAEWIGFQLIDTIPLKVCGRPKVSQTGNEKFNKTDEKIYIFKK